MSLRRNNVSDFLRDVGLRTSGTRVWNGVINTDGTVNVNLNGTTQYRVFYPGFNGGSATDGSQGDRVNIYSTDGTVASADAALFLQNLV
jgi:hypothetical protein